MAGLIWTAVTLSLLLYVGNCVEPPAGPSLKQLKILVDKIWYNYMPSYEKNSKDHFPMFSLAVSIPYNNNLQGYDIDEDTDPADTLKATLLRCEVYKGTRMVAATVLKWPDVLDQCPNERVQWNNFPTKGDRNKAMRWDQVKGVAEGFTRADHAEYRTLKAFNTLTNNLNKNDFMLFYVLSSPCVSKCANINNPMNILKSINGITKWDNYALVFTNVFIAGDDQSDKKKRKAALEQLGTYKVDQHGKSIGLDHIFRCDTDCRRCYIKDNVTEVNPLCYEDPDKTARNNNLPSNQLPSGSGGGKGLCRRGIGNKGKILSTNVDRRRLLAT